MPRKKVGVRKEEEPGAERKECRVGGEGRRRGVRAGGMMLTAKREERDRKRERRRERERGRERERQILRKSE